MALQAELERLPSALRAEIHRLEMPDAVEYLAREIAQRVRDTLTVRISEGLHEADSIVEANRLFSGVGSTDTVLLSVLTAIHDAVASPTIRPVVPLSQSALITNDQGLNYHAVLRSELLSADRVDFICPFIGNQGINLILDLLAGFGPNLRVITTTYLGGTNQRALERLVSTGAEVKIVYERSEQKTGLHAKAWIFHRDSGFTTATVGSSNLSPRALVDGLEWNVRLGQSDANQVLKELIVTFERLWQDPLYEPFDPTRDADRLRMALKSERTSEQGPTFFADLHPLPHQQEALDELRYARLEGKSKNLVVAATGTGKTLLAAFDYRRLTSEIGGRPCLLFVAHREDILRQSLGAFRAVMRDSDFGELNVGFERAEVWQHVFASVQSLGARQLDTFAPDHFDVIVVDEFHHAAAPTYTRLLDHFNPRQLVGLTATPERADGQSVIDRFGAPTYELRLWHALDRGLLCPFHYFGVDDGTDLTDLKWEGGKYADGELEHRFVQRGEERAKIIVRELREKAADLDHMRAVAFCATIEHARYMAQRFQDGGLEAHALHSGLGPEVRKELVRRFRDGGFPILCTVDLFNEGVDIPEIDTVLFLRPTESATVYIQQLGRGLRNHPDKGALTVLDFVGQQNKKFRMDLRFRAMTGLSRRELDHAIKTGFPILPPGCNIRLDRTSQERVLRNLKEAVPTTTKSLLLELRRMAAVGAPITLGRFLTETGLEPIDLYRNGRSFTDLKHAAGLVDNASSDAKSVGAFCHVDDRRRIEGYVSELKGKPYDHRFERMMAFTLTGATSIGNLDPVVREEMIELLETLQESSSAKLDVAPDLTFALHGHYSRDEMVGIFRDNPVSMRQGTFYVQELGLDVHMITLRKSEREFSPTTRYADYFIVPDRLHWESQSTTSAASPTGQRLINGTGRHLFFVRESKGEDGRTVPFLCLGFGKPISHEGEKPIRLVWELEHAVPDHLYMRLRNAAG
ncbi:DUF3427 domain-containing protein [bacterium]|nr:MAG: DUF3427 domain-containing protein [bacterium]